MQILRSEEQESLKVSLLDAMRGNLLSGVQADAGSKNKMPQGFIEKVDMALTLINTGKPDEQVIPVLAAISR